MSVRKAQQLNCASWAYRFVVLKHALIIFGNRSDEEDGAYAVEHVDPLASFAALAADVDDAKAPWVVMIQ